MSWQDDPEVSSAPAVGKWAKDPEIGDAQKMGMTDRIAGFVNRQAQGFQQGMQIPNLVAQKAMQGVTGFLNLPHRLIGAPEITTDPATLTKGFEGVIQDVNREAGKTFLMLPTPGKALVDLLPPKFLPGGPALEPQIKPIPQPIAHFLARGMADMATPENAVLAATGVGLEPTALKLLSALFGAQQVPEVAKALQQGDKETALLKAVESGAMLGGGLIPERAQVSGVTPEMLAPTSRIPEERQLGRPGGTPRFIAPEQGPAQRVFSGVPVTPEDLRPAIRWAGRLFVGERGMTHSDIVDKFNLPKEINHFHPGRGFAVKGATKPEEFLDRQQTAKIIGKATADAGGADSMDLPGAAQHKLLRESEAPNAISELRADRIPEAQPSGDIRQVEEKVRQGTGAEGAAREAQVEGQEGVQGRAGASQRQALEGRGIDDRQESYFSGVPIISREFKEKFGELGRAIISNPTAKKFESTRPSYPQPGERITTTQAIGNKLNRVANAVKETDRILNPYDVIFDEADGGKGQYNGVLHKTIRQPTDEAYQRSASQARDWTGNLASIVKSNNLDDLASQRIGVAMTAVQEGGRERMIAMGVEPATIDKITSSLTYAEKQWMKEFRRIDDGILKRLQEVASKADKIKVKEVKNHFPYMRDFDKYTPEPDEIATNPKLLSKQAKKEGITPDDVIWAGLPTELGGRVVPGSTISRTPGAKTPIRLDAFGVADKYLRDMSHYLESRELVKKLGEVARSDEFQKTYGDLNQKLVVEYLNNFARQGRWKRNQVIDALRRGVGRGIVGLRLPSQVVHMANIPLAMQRTGGPIWWNRGLQASLGEEGVKFLHDNFEETFQRGGGEPAQAEIAEHQAASRLGKMYDSYGRFAFALQREIDMRSAQATVMGIYMRGLEEKGIKGEDFASVPVDKDLVQKARVLARRAVASPIFKDVPPALQRGGSIGRSFLQFQNTFLDQWSNIRYDLAKVGVPEALKGNPRIALTMAAALASMLAVETTVKYGYKKALTEATGGEMQEDDTYQNHLWHEALRRVPGAGQIMSAIMYGETGIPSIDVLLAPAKEGVKALKSKDEASATIAATRAVGAAAELGIPGASQATDIAVGLERGKFYKPHEKRLEEFTKKPISEMSTDERIEAERSFRQRAQQPMSRDAKAQSAERAVANIEKRGEEVEAKLPKETRNWMKARGFSVPGFDNKIQMGGTRVYLTKEETKKLEGYVQEEYQNAIKEIQSERPFDDMPQQRQQEAFNKRLRLAAKIARNRVVEEMDRDAQKMNMTKKYKLLQGE